MAEGRDKIVIVGTGWAGFVLSQELNDSKFDIFVISPEETRPYTPLLVCISTSKWMTTAY